MTDCQKNIERLATELMGWEEDGHWWMKNGEAVEQKSDPIHGIKWNPYQDENHARQVIEKVMENDQMSADFVRELCDGRDDVVPWWRLMKATLSERMDAVVSVLPEK